MIIYNTTFHIDEEIHDKCLKFFKIEYIPALKQCEEIMDINLFLIHSPNDVEGYNYAIQTTFQNLDLLELWIINSKNDIDSKIIDTFQNQVCGFSTILEKIQISE